MRHSRILDYSYLGPHDVPNKFDVGDIQLVHFTAENDSPFYMYAEDQHFQKFDEIVDTKTEILNMCELITALKVIGIKNPRGNKEK